MKHRRGLHRAHANVINVPCSSINKRTTLATFTNVTIHRSFKTNSNSNKIQNFAYKREAKSSLKTNSNTRFVSSKDHFETTQRHHKRKKKRNKSPYIRAILSTLIILTIIAVLLCVLLIKLNQKKKVIANKEIGLRWNSTGITIAGVSNVSGADNMHLNTPVDLVLDYKSTMFIADRYNHRIQKYVRGSMNGTTVAGFGNGTSSNSLYGLGSPVHLIVDDEENLYIAESGNNRVSWWSRNALSGVVVAGFGGSGNATNKFLGPHGIEFDKVTNILYIADYGNHRIVTYAKNATNGTVVFGGPGLNTTQVSYPVGIYLDHLSNSLLIANFGANNVVRWVESEYQWILMAGDMNGIANSTSTTLRGPTDMILDPMGNMYVADRDNQRIQLFMSGEYVGKTIAGTTGMSGTNASLLKSPWCVKLDNQLNLYVADTNNYRIQKFLRY